LIWLYRIRIPIKDENLDPRTGELSGSHRKRYKILVFRSCDALDGRLEVDPEA